MTLDNDDGNKSYMKYYTFSIFPIYLSIYLSIYQHVWLKTVDCFVFLK